MLKPFSFKLVNKNQAKTITHNIGNADDEW